MNWEALAIELAKALKTVGEVVAQVKEKRQTAGITAAADALTVIGAIVESVGLHKTPLHEASPEAIHEEIERLRRMLADADAAADRALEEKFDKSTEE